MNYFIEAFTKKFAQFNGRARRSEYWYFVLFNVLGSVVFVFLASIIHVPILANIWSLATLVPGIAVAVRRMHDVGKSGWFILIPIYNLILACTEGDQSANEYGPNPKQVDSGSLTGLGTNDFRNTNV